MTLEQKVLKCELILMATHFVDCPLSTRGSCNLGYQNAAHGWDGTTRRLRRQSKMPVIFLTSKEDEVDEILGLRMGADDYIKKPFSQRLLIERIRTLLRRHATISKNTR